METLCRIRDLQRAVREFETSLQQAHGICLNEGMMLCTLSTRESVSCSELCEGLGLTPSNTSKVLRALEEKDCIKRELGTEDKRQMYFSITAKGRDLLESIDFDAIKAPELLKQVFGEH